MRLFFLTIPKPLRQHPIFKKMTIHSAIFKDLEEKLPIPQLFKTFHISSIKTNGNLHLKLFGDFDVDSAQELTNAILMHGVGYWDIFIDTNYLETIHPLGRVAFKMNISNFKGQLNNLFFIGEHKHEIAPN